MISGLSQQNDAPLSYVKDKPDVCRDQPQEMPYLHHPGSDMTGPDLQLAAALSSAGSPVLSRNHDPLSIVSPAQRGVLYRARPGKDARLPVTRTAVNINGRMITLHARRVHCRPPAKNYCPELTTIPFLHLEKTDPVS